MSFHRDKYKVFIISKKNDTFATSYNLHDHTLETVNSAKYLGYSFTSELRWNDYVIVNNICNKANREIAFLKTYLNVGPATVKENINAYTKLVRPIVEYAIQLWDPHFKSDTDRIKMFQRRIPRYVSNKPHYQSSVRTKLQYLTWTSLEQRRKEAKLIML
ncbi:unnamed protein product [Mytilus coruscus]|uniref:Uncharacterized protein n=1 Tax=Mytilus coruscus TaxID=42192 RepID=A0A6J8E995_MYTCO|nr:unnamed protein product [Mytilus coruscus]